MKHSNKEIDAIIALQLAQSAKMKQENIVKASAMLTKMRAELLRTQVSSVTNVKSVRA